MSEPVAVTNTNINWIQQATNNPIEFVKSLEDLLENFGPEELGNAATQQFLGTFISSLKDLINDSDLPQGIKDAATAVLDAHAEEASTKCPCSEEAADAVANSSESDAINQTAEEAAESAAEAANEGTAPAADLSDEAQTEADAEAANEGTAPAADLSDEAQVEADAEAANEGTAGGHDALDEINNDQAAAPSKGEKSGRRGSWLEVLAGDLADIQSAFLDKAMIAKDKMMEETDNAGSGEAGKSSAFLDAQAQYTATIQLFTIFSNQTSTTIKSIGEALAGISRKT